MPVGVTPKVYAGRNFWGLGQLRLFAGFSPARHPAQNVYVYVLGPAKTNLDRDMFKPFCSHSGLLGRYSGCMLEDLHRFYCGFFPRDAPMRALRSDRQDCSHNVSENVKRIS